MKVEILNNIELNSIGYRRNRIFDEQIHQCKICAGETFQALNLGYHPFANSLVDSPNQVIKVYPLALHICRRCSGAQLNYYADSKDLYSDYKYITPVSKELSLHYKNIEEFLSKNDYLMEEANILEIGSNIGRLLEYLTSKKHRCLGVDPAGNICRMAEEKGLTMINAFFNKGSAKKIVSQHGKQDCIIARHCFAHNEEPWLMLDGVKEALDKDGSLVIENAYFLDTVNHREFDQVYHEHMYYYNLRSITAIVERHGMKLVDCFHSPIHGGTMMYVIKFSESRVNPTDRVKKYLQLEKNMHTEEFHYDFLMRVDKNKKELVNLIQQLKFAGQTIHAYGASAKSTTLLNYYHLDRSLIPCVVDSTPTKQGRYLPLVSTKVISEEEARFNPPDYYLLTIWNYKDEIIQKVRSWGNQKTKFILPHPTVEIIE